ncbi:hypothetical protein L6452_05097 [Arctium lappa]|uniref:Uncharacterized protein n=1 Tax=Arctium lappa TaxID=4217 RepID=A0ACB9EGI5_ARCLA|nr:hypothetical protein L6452_05097 [Arctium lappa]
MELQIHREIEVLQREWQGENPTGSRICRLGTEDYAEKLSVPSIRVAFVILLMTFFEKGLSAGLLRQATYTTARLGTFRKPDDLALIRMQVDSTLPVAQRHNYTNAVHALYRINTDKGVLAIWKGAGPMVVRAMALNMGMLASYDQSVEFFKDNLGFGEGATILGKIKAA